jgi:hypothetical protein
MTTTVTRLNEKALAVSGTINSIRSSLISLNDSITTARDAIPRHALRIKPSGQALTATWHLRHAIGLFTGLPDELILILLEYLDAGSLLSLGQTCKALYAFTRSDDLWKSLFIQYVPNP